MGALYSQKAANNQQLEFNWGAGDAGVRDVALNLMGAGAGLCIIFAHRHWTAMQRLRSFSYYLLASSVFLTGFSTVVQRPDCNTKWRSMHAFNPAKESMTLLVRLETFADRGLETTLSIRLLPDPDNIHIPIREIAGNRFRTLDNVRNLFVFKGAPDETEYFFLGSLVLKKAGS